VYRYAPCSSGSQFSDQLACLLYAQLAFLLYTSMSSVCLLVLKVLNIFWTQNHKLLGKMYL